MPRFDDLQIFVRTAERGSLSAAARELELSPAVASAALKRLETELDVRLFARSTRSLRLTAEGELYLAHARAALQSLDDGRQLLAGGKSEIAGNFQVSAPSDFGRNVLLPWLDEFQALHPRMSLRLLISDRQADLYRQPVDVAFRLGLPGDSNLVALPLAPDNRRVLCGSPEYFARHGKPRHPDELQRHNCLLYMLGGRAHERWRFSDSRRQHEVTVHGDRLCDDADVVRRWAVAGHGLVYKSWLDVAADVHAGRLEVALANYLGEATPMNLFCTHRAQLSRAVAQLREFVQLRCAELMHERPWS